MHIYYPYLCAENMSSTKTLLTMNQSATASDPHFAVLAFPFGTHAAPLLSIASRLASAAPNAHFSFFSTAESNNFLSSHKHYFLLNLKACNVPNGVPDGYVFTGKPVEEETELFIKADPENLRKAMSQAAAETMRQISCLVMGSFLWFAVEMAEEIVTKNKTNRTRQSQGSKKN